MATHVLMFQVANIQVQYSRSAFHTRSTPFLLLLESKYTTEICITSISERDRKIYLVLVSHGTDSVDPTQA